MEMNMPSLPTDEELAELPVVVVAAHPDDEVIGLGSRLESFRQLKAIVHITDGAPRTGSDIANAGQKTWREYADLRRLEFKEALEQANCCAAQTPCFWCPDQRALNRIALHARRLAALFERLGARHVFTHPYEGGHPDHDAVAVSVRCAVALCEGRGVPMPTILEFSSYHASASGLESECFLNHADVPVRERVLTAGQQERKRRLFSCYKSQQRVLEWFPLKCEPIRLAPVYDFARAPHEGQLLYETFGWGFTGDKWRKLAAAGLRKVTAA